MTSGVTYGGQTYETSNALVSGQLKTQTVSASQTNDTIRGTAERLGTDMRMHFGTLGSSEAAPHTPRDVLRA